MITQISVDDVASGKWRPNPEIASWLCNGNYAWLCQQALYYVRELARTGKYTLTVWSPHCILGSDGHPLVGLVQEARMFHSYVRGVQSDCEIKGGNPLTENYSVLKPEVLTRFDGQPLAQKNVRFIKTLMESDVVVIGGEADSHCVASSIEDLLGEILAQDPELAKKVYILEDCMSSVVVPGIVDYTPQAEAAHRKFADAGMHLVKSTDPMETWPGLKLVA
jgi:nicotinamidase-related amidase